MLAENNTNPLEPLFEQYQSRFDLENKLTPLGPKLDIGDFWDKLVHELDLDAETLCRQISEITQLPVHKGAIQTPAELAGRVPRKTQERFHIALVGLEAGEPVIATANPLDPQLLEALTFMFDRHFRLVLAPPDVITEGMGSAQQARHGGNQQSAGIHLSTHGASEAENRATPKLARKLLLKSLEENASDLHIQPFINGSVVRIRVDGLLKRLTLIPEKVADSVIRHFKAQAGMDPTGSLVPQDGRMLVDVSGREYDLRISTLPVAGHKEKLVVRFLNRQSVFNLTEIGFSLDELHAVQRLASRPSGVVLVCGPTGSGKTTTLYSILNTLNNEETSIMTVENPVEYQMAGLAQTDVNEKAGMTFARALRAILRQDPEILLIGEIRDEETAQIAMQSALTGHLVFSTLHTNDSLSAIPRLFDLGINPVILAESLSGILSQRLLRTLCKDCREDTQSETDPAAMAFKSVTKVEQGCAPVGCEKCKFTGYKGRTVVAEIVEINQDQRELLLGGEQDIAKFKAAMQGTFNSMSMSASRLIISGLTTATEASRVLGQQFWYALADAYKQPVPDLSALTESGESSKAANGVLIAGHLDGASHALQKSLEESWLEVWQAESPEEAESALRKHENIDLVVLELSSQFSDSEMTELVSKYRRHMAWSRLPALIRIPASKPEWEALLKEQGATSKFVTNESPLKDVVALVQSAVSEKQDFKWGSN